MKPTRNLWISILFVVVLVVGSVLAFATGTKPVLGLDLEGGVSVVLKAPDGTPREVMERALENIRNRVDAFGVAEPQIFLTGVNIEVQLPGLASGTVEPRPTTEYCLVGEAGTVFGCYAARPDAQAVRDALKVEDQPRQVCLFAGDGTKGECFPTQSGADSELAALTSGPEPSPTPSSSPSPSPSASSPPAGPTSGGKFCVTGTDGTSYGCFDSQKKADAAKKAVTTEVTQHEFCLGAQAPGASETPTKNTTPTPSASPSAGASAAPSASPSPAALPARNDTQGLDQYPCASSKSAADAALATVQVKEQTQRFCVISSSGRNLGCTLTRGKAEALRQATGQERLLQIIGTTARLEEREELGQISKGDPSFDSTEVTCPNGPVDEGCSFKDLQDKQVTFLSKDGKTKYLLGPVEITGDKIKKATAEYRSATQTSVKVGWVVTFELTSEGAKQFGEITTRLVNKPLAIVLDRQVISSPTINEPITGGSGEISGSFSEQEARDLATVLNAGALPVELSKQEVVTVSPTLGKESLHQGLIAGIAGLIALAVYMLFYYRLLGVVAWAGMSIWAVLAFALVSLAGKAFGYSLTLAGIAGLVISLGVTADSYIVFFERLKDEVRHGKTPRSAVTPAFKRAYKTIVAADTVTGLAAAVLYVTAISSVRGFALTLGVATMLDLFVVYFFKRPTVFLIARNERLVRLRGFGLASGVAADEPGAVTGGEA